MRQSYLTIDKGKAKTVLFNLCLCLWICRDSKIPKCVILLDVAIYYSKVTNMYIGIAEKLWSLILLLHMAGKWGCSSSD